MEVIDLLIQARWVIPVAPAGVVLAHHSVAVNHGKIIALLPHAVAEQRFQAQETRVLDQHVLIPGLINSHSHAGMTLLRGIGDDLPLMTWLQQAIWPAEARHVGDEFVYLSTRLAAAEMLKGGITTTNEMYFFPDAAARAFTELGMRALLGITVLDFPTPYAHHPADYLDKGLSARQNWNHPLIQFALAPHAPYTTSDTTLQDVVMLANELDLPLHMHVHETAEEVNQSMRQFGERPLARLERLGLLGPNFIAVHGVHLNHEDIQRLQHHQCHVAHCPTSNMKLASGIAPIRALLEAGVNLGLGSDGAASNNRQDLFQEARQAALLAKVSSQDAATLPAQQALYLATLGGAQLLGLAQQIGSIEIGKEADLCAIDLGDFCLAPCYDLISHLIYVIGREHVSDVWVSGKTCIKNGQMVTINHLELLNLAHVWQNSHVTCAILAEGTADPKTLL